MAPTLEELFTGFDKFLEEGDASVRTRKYYRSDLEKVVTNVNRAKVYQTSADYESLVVAIEEGYSELVGAYGSINRVRTAVNNFFKYLANSSQYNGRRPDLPTPPKGEITIPQIDLGLVLSNVHRYKPPHMWCRDRDVLIASLLFHTAPTPSELEGLDSSDVKGKKGGSRTIKIRGKRERVLVTPITMAKVFDAYESNKPSGQNGAYILSSSGDRLTARAVGGIVAEIGQRAEVNGLTPISFRHAYMRRHLGEGRPSRSIAEELGVKPAQVSYFRNTHM